MTPSSPKVVHVVAAFIRAGDAVLLDRRHEGAFAGMWEFPGGKREPGETEAEALMRELKEELGVDAEIGEPIGRSASVHHDVEIQLVLYEAQIFGTPQALDVAFIQWFPIHELRELPMPPADRPLVDQVLATFR